MTDENGLPLDFVVTAGQRNDCTQAIALLGDRRADAVVADRAFDTDAILAHIEAMGAQAVIPPKRDRKVQRLYDRELYKQRHRIECCVNRLKQFRRFATRYCKSIQAFQSFVSLACARLHLELYVDTA